MKTIMIVRNCFSASVPYSAGDVVDLPPQEADELVRIGRAHFCKRPELAATPGAGPETTTNSSD